MMSVAFRLMPLERMLGAEQRYTIDWDARVETGQPPRTTLDEVRRPA